MVFCHTKPDRKCENGHCGPREYSHAYTARAGSTMSFSLIFVKIIFKSNKNFQSNILHPTCYSCVWLNQTLIGWFPLGNEYLALFSRGVVSRKG